MKVILLELRSKKTIQKDMSQIGFLEGIKWLVLKVISIAFQVYIKNVFKTWIVEGVKTNTFKLKKTYVWSDAGFVQKILCTFKDGLVWGEFIYEKHKKWKQSLSIFSWWI